MAKDMLTFDAGDLSDDQLMTVMAVANIAKARMDAVEKGCKAVLVGRMETGHQPAMLDGEELADIQRTAGGGDGGWVVKDAEAYGAWLDRQEGKGRRASKYDELLPDAVNLVMSTGQASASSIQRRFRVGYTRAARLIDEMEDLSIVGPNIGSKPREILMNSEQAAAALAACSDE